MKCEHCGKEITGESITKDICGNADKDPERCHFCSDKCEEEYEDENGVDECPNCFRRITYDDGAFYNFRPHPNKGEGWQVCRQCLPKVMASDGVTPETIEYLSGDAWWRLDDLWDEIDYDYEKLKAAGWRIYRDFKKSTPTPGQILECVSEIAAMEQQAMITQNPWKSGVMIYARSHNTNLNSAAKKKGA